MIGLFRGELAKAVSTRTVYAFLLLSVAFAALNAVIVAVASGELHHVGEKEEALSVLPILLMVWGLVGAAGEYRHRTAAPAALVARRGRGALLFARLTAYAFTGLALGALASVASLAFGLPLLRRQPGPTLDLTQVGSVLAGNLAACVLAAILGAAVGALVRNQIIGVVGLLILNFAVIPLLASANQGLTNLTPFGASSVLSRMTHNTTISVSTSAVVLAVWTALLVAAAVLNERRRDLA